MRTPIFEGSGVAIITPFKDGSIDYESFENLIEFQVASGTDAIIVCGTTGESATMTEKEHKAAIEFVAQKASGRVKVIAGTGSNNTQHALEMSKFADSLNIDGLLLVTPYYNKTSQAGLVRHYQLIADSVNTPIILYNVPSRTGMGFTAESYALLAKHPMINGVKEASGNFSLIAKTRHLCGDDFYIWSGNDDQIVPVMSMGGKGIISVAANVIPSVIRDIAHSCIEGNYARSMALQVEYADLIDKLFIETNPIPVKAAAKMLGLCSEELRLPLVDISAANAEKLKNSMIDVGLKVK